ncbi:fimbria/pilus periplasmic chaperone [Enterobacteriaceae bacterium LUAb1]
MGRLDHCISPLILASVVTVGLWLTAETCRAAVALDRTRAVIKGTEKSISLGIINQNTSRPYLAQVWIEDAEGKKISEPLAVLPSMQRIEPGMKSQVTVLAMAKLNLLSQDREHLYYLNLREIPPKSSQPNTLQIALQTRIKLFYRPASLIRDQHSKPWQERLTLTRKNGYYIAHNPTPYFVTLSGAANVQGKRLKGFEPVMIAPKSSKPLKGSAAALGNQPVLTYINDYGNQPKLIFGCCRNMCSVKDIREG